MAHAVDLVPVPANRHLRGDGVRQGSNGEVEADNVDVCKNDNRGPDTLRERAAGVGRAESADGNQRDKHAHRASEEVRSTPNLVAQ